MKNDILEVLYTNDEIILKAQELGKRITKDYENQELIIVGLLKGCAPFMMELIKSIDLYAKLDFMTVSSYVGTSSEDLILKRDISFDVKNTHVLIVEDIVDTGRTLTAVCDMLKNRGALSVEVCTLLDKKEGRIVDFTPKYIGFDIPNKFVVGYGLDYNELYRNLPFVGVLKKEVYEK